MTLERLELLDSSEKDISSHQTPERNDGAETESVLAGIPEELHDLLLQPEKAQYIPFDVSSQQIRVGYVPGVMPGKWFNRWHERFEKSCPLIEVPLSEETGLASLNTLYHNSPLTHMVLLRPENEPESADKERFHSITLYREKLVVVLPQDHVLSVYEESLPLQELAEEFLLQDPDTVPEWKEISASFRAAHPQKLPEMRHSQDAIELVAAGLGLLIVPMSIARFYHRKDLTYRIVEDLDESKVNLVWERKVRSETEEEIIQDFIGICRGRTAGSDRGSATLQTQREQAAREKEEAKRKRRAANTRRETRDRKARNAKNNGNARQHQAQSKKASGSRSSGGRKKR